MAISSYEIGLATRDDVTGILDLQERNLRSVGGALSVRFSRDWFEAAISDMPIIVARSDEQVVGYVVSTPLTAQAHDSIIQAMLRAYPGSLAPPLRTIMVRFVSRKTIADEVWLLRCSRH
jgi:hypothetical protein